MSTSGGTVRVVRSGPCVTVEWDRPPLHIFDIALLSALAGALRSESVRTAHCVVLKGARRRWSAGFAVEDHLADRVRPMFDAFRGVRAAIRDVPVPTLAAVEGPCLGGGLELLSACDLAVAAESATFGQPEVRLGVFPPLAAATYPGTLGPKRAAEVLYLGETLDARRALEYGLVGRIVPDARLDDEVLEMARQLGRFRRETLLLLKEVLAGPVGAAESRIDAAEHAYLDRLMALPAAEEGLRAFLEKRPPAWPGGPA